MRWDTTNLCMSRDFRFPGNKSPKETFLRDLIWGGKSSKKKSCGENHTKSCSGYLSSPVHNQVQTITKCMLGMALPWKLTWNHVWSPKFWYILFLLGKGGWFWGFILHVRRGEGPKALSFNMVYSKRPESFNASFITAVGVSKNRKQIKVLKCTSSKQKVRTKCTLQSTDKLQDFSPFHQYNWYWYWTNSSNLNIACCPQPFSLWLEPSTEYLRQCKHVPSGSVGCIK